MVCNCSFTGGPCCGSCLGTPENPRYYDNPDYPANPFNPTESISSENVSLPIRLDWDDVEGWKDGWIDEEAAICFKECRSSPEECATRCLKTCLSEYTERGELIKKGVCEERCEKIGKEPSVCLSCGGACDKEPTPFNCKYPTGAPMYCQAGSWRSKCLADCQESCKDTVNFYQIKIEGDEKSLRDPEALRKIDVLKKKIEEETDSPKIREYENEIERIRREELEITEYKEFLDRSEFIPPSPCFFKSNQTYQWQIRACCSKDEKGCGSDTITSSLALAYGGDPISKGGCGPWSEKWEFTTNPAPEPKWPYNFKWLEPDEYPIDPEKYPFSEVRYDWFGDPDWGHPEKREDVPYEGSRKLEWCEIEDSTLYEETTVYQEKYYKPLSYNILLYYSEDDLCHPQLSFGGQCVPKLLSPDEAKREKLPPDELDDSYSTFFTKKTPYAWQVSACKDAYGLDCSDYSQLWKFSTGDWVLEASLVGPPNDSQTSIGLPALLKWTSRGANSFNYELIGVSSGTTTVANVAFDYPQLALNTVYSWRVQPCLGYEGKECEDAWYGPWFFKTTGQPPGLVHPSPNATDVPISINFDWEDVPGAKSYIFKIQGGELSKEEPTEKSEFLLDYPDLRQETDYTWQVKTCARREGEVCGNYSSPQSFKTFKLALATNPSPRNGAAVSTAETHRFSWDGILGARYYQFQIDYNQRSKQEIRKECIEKEGESIIEIVTTNSILYQLACNGLYQWQVRACLDKDCQETGSWSELWAVNMFSPKPVQEILKEIFIDEISPQVFEKIPETAAKRVAEIVSEKTLEILTTYPEEKWLTAAAVTPEVPETILEEVLNEEIEDLQEIANEVGKRVAEKVLQVTQEIPQALLFAMLTKIAEIPLLEDTLEIFEKGMEETWQAESQKAVNKAEVMPELPEEVLSHVLASMAEEITEEVLKMLSAKIPETQAKIKIAEQGLIPCGRTVNIDNTPWDETERCQIKHIFIMLFSLVDFFLWKLIPLILVLLAVASGVIFYFSAKLEAATPIAKAKSVWRAAGIGLAIIFFAWTIVSFFLTLFGYQVGIFGHWWQIF